MRIAVLGPLEVVSEELTPVAVPGAKERLLLAVLTASAPGVVSSDRLVDTLWDGTPPDSAHKSLQAHLVRLRSALEPDRPKGSTGRHVVRRGRGYALAIDRGDVDALCLGDLAAKGRARLASGHPGDATRLLTEGLDLWRGEPYADWPDAAFAEDERRRLIEVRSAARTALFEAELARGRHADVVPELERSVAEEPLREEWWRLLMLALYRAGRQSDALSAGRRARALLAEELGVDPAPALRAMEAAILAQDAALDLRATATPAGRAADGSGATCPYKGLAAYQVADAPLFHGRQRLVAGLVARLVDTPLLAVSGPSGAGKSSVVRAGLVPVLVAGAVSGSERWQPVIVTPGRTPADVLADLTGESPPATPVLLVCDQFEELWSRDVDPAERTAFLDAVLGLLDDGIVVRCVVVVRGDHLGRLAEHADFTERLNGAIVLVPALADPELREIVREPARSVGLSVETELLDVVVPDVLGQVGALPLLSTALVGTWERRRGDLLTLAGYLEAGGVAGALTRSAEEAYAALDDAGRDLARRLLVRLADVDDGGALVRRPVPLAEVAVDSERRRIVEVFVGRRLLSVDGDRLEVAHEALLTAWPRLARWLEDDAAGRAVRRHLAPAAREWETVGRPDDELFRGTRLDAALEWAAGTDADVTPAEQRFLDASKARAEAELTDARDRARREAAARHRTRRLAVGLAAVLVVALVAAGLAVVSQRAAERASLVADANRLAALSTTVESLDLSYLLAAQGFRLADTPQTQDGLLATLAERRRAVHGATIPEIFFRSKLADGGETLFAAGSGKVQSWAVTSGKPPRVILEMGEDWPTWRAVDASPTAPLLALAGVGTDGPWLRLVDADGGEQTVLSGDALGGEPFGITFTADGRSLDVVLAEPVDGGARSTWRVVRVDPADGTRRDTGIAGALAAAPGDLDTEVSDDGSTALLFSWGSPVPLTLVDLATGSQATVEPPARDAEIVDRRPLHAGAALLWDDGAMTLHDRTGRAVQQVGDQQEPVNSVAQAPDGTWAATVGDEGRVARWDVDPATGRWSPGDPLDARVGEMDLGEIDTAGTRMFTFAEDGGVVVWDVGPDGGFGTVRPGIPDRWLANPPEVVEPGRLVVAATRPVGPPGIGTLPYGGPGTLGVAATFLDPRTGGVVEQMMLGDTVGDAVFGASVAVSPDRRWIAVTSGLATTVLDARTREVVERIELPPTGYVQLDGSSPATGVVCCAAWRPDGSRLLLGTQGASGAGGIAVVDPAAWEVERVDLTIRPEALEFSADGRSLAVASGDSDEIVILDGRTLDERQTVELRGPDRVYAMSFSPDGRLLIAGGDFGTLHVVDTRTWEPRAPVPLGGGALLQIEWLRDERTAVVSSGDGTITLFDAERGFVRAVPLPGAVDTGPARTFVIPDDGRELAVLSERSAVLRYPTEPSSWLRAACAVAGRDLTRDEWDRYLPGREYQATCTDLG